MKTKEELIALKEEIETLNKKLNELSEEELAQVSGGLVPGIHYKPDREPPVSVFEPPARHSDRLWVSE